MDDSATPGGAGSQHGCVAQIVAQAPNLQHFRLASSRVGPAGGIAIASALATGEATVQTHARKAVAGQTAQLMTPARHAAVSQHARRRLDCFVPIVGLCVFFTLRQHLLCACRLYSISLPRAGHPNHPLSSQPHALSPQIVQQLFGAQLKQHAHGS